MQNNKNNSGLVANHNIRFPEVRVVTDKGDLGVMKIGVAQKMATDSKLDLILIAPTAKPPVCKIMEINKYFYEQKSKAKEQEKKNRMNRIDVKEITMRPVIGQHDLDTKIKQMNKFLDGGDKVRVSIQFKGREITHTDRGFQIANEIISKLTHGTVEEQPKLNGNSIKFLINFVKDASTSTSDKIHANQ